MKVGRNDPCPCGSGRKFKKCCGRRTGAAKYVTGLNEIQRTLFPSLDANHEAIWEVMTNAAEAAFQGARSSPEWNTAEFDANRVKLVERRVWSDAKTLLANSPHSAQFWYQLARQSVPWFARQWQRILVALGANAMDLDYIIGQSVRRVTDVAFLASSVVEPHEFAESQQARGIQYGDVPIDTLAALFAYGQLLSDCEVKYRLASKGIAVFDPYNQVSGSAVWKSVRNYELRRDKFETFVGRCGIWYDVHSFSPIRPSFCWWWGSSIHPDQVVRAISTNPPASVEGKFGIGPLIDPRIVEYWRTTGSEDSSGSSGAFLVGYDRLLREFSQEIDAVFGITAEQLTTFFYSVALLIRSYHGLGPFGLSPDLSELEWHEDYPPDLRQRALQKLEDILALGWLRSTPEDWRHTIGLCIEELRRSDP